MNASLRRSTSGLAGPRTVARNMLLPIDHDTCNINEGWHKQRAAPLVFCGRFLSVIHAVRNGMLLLKKQGLWQKRKVLWAADLLNLKRTNAMFLLQLSWIKHSSSMSCSCLRSTSQTGRMCTAVTPACAMDRQRAARMWVSEYVGTCLTSRYYQEVLNPWGWNMQRLLPISMHISLRAITQKTWR